MPYENDAQGLTRRAHLAGQIMGMSQFSIYAQAVYCVNQMLRVHRVGISEQAYQSISRNLTSVSTGRLYETSASLAESRVFARDTVTALKSGDITSALITASGVAINGLGGGLFFGHYDRNKLMGIERYLYDNFHM
ncbi:hypothetical protein MUU46_08490 [Scandinavium sp. TWS1a]|uniref:hypothetical protein n=1 Tax=Scandinavium tedordense TaxID=2926521 RepID=UPI0013573EE9|nr:hypothetical protein [Scandinavium tedordense]MCS2170356.1 hypothetical protein [Scandinavium tedordense]